MAQLEKLGIAGFRSYSAEKIQTIEFNKPLSLIWGENGSGKTVIIWIFRPSLKCSSTSRLEYCHQDATKASSLSLIPELLAETRSMLRLN